MQPKNATNRPRMSLIVAFGLSIALAPMISSAATNPIAQPRVEISKTIAVAPAGEQNYVLKFGTTTKQVKGKTIKVTRAGDGAVTGVWVDTMKLIVPIGSVVSVAV